MEAMGIVSDLAFAIMPMFLVWPLHRPVMERVLLSILMGLGVIAAVAGAMKIYHINAWNPRIDTFRDWVSLLWWYRVEEIGLITAACAPFLKPLIQRILDKTEAFRASPLRFITISLNSIRSGPVKDVFDSTEAGSIFNDPLESSDRYSRVQSSTSSAKSTPNSHPKTLFTKVEDAKVEITSGERSTGSTAELGPV
jgi:hypothetical protein